MKSTFFLLALLGAQDSGAASLKPHDMPMPLSTHAAAKLQTHAQVSGASVAALPPISKQTAAYFTLKNTGKVSLKLTGVSSALAGSSMLMVSERDPAGLLGMKMVSGFELKPGQSLTLSPTGAHVMLSDLRRPLRVGELVELKLSFSDGSAMKFKAPVKRF